MTVGFENSLYVVEEGSSLSVCVELEGTIQRSIVVSISAIDGSTHGE